MEKMSWKFAKYFYIILLTAVAFHLLDTIFVVIKNGSTLTIFILMALAIINVILLGNSIKFNKDQRFEECKTNAKILRVTMALLLIFHTICVWGCLYRVTLRDNIMLLSIIELVLSYRIECIEHLEKLADQFSKDNVK